MTCNFISVMNRDYFITNGCFAQITSLSDKRKPTMSDKDRKRKSRQKRKAEEEKEKEIENERSNIRRSKRKLEEEERRQAQVKRTKKNRSAKEYKQNKKNTQSKLESKEQKKNDRFRQEKRRQRQWAESTLSQRRSKRLATNRRMREKRVQRDEIEAEEARCADRLRKLGERNQTAINRKLEEKKKDEDDLQPYIDFAVAQAMRTLHRTRHPDDPKKHQSYVCICCDCFIPATEPIRGIKRKELIRHKKRLSVQEYEIYYEEELEKDITDYYHVKGFRGMLLSPRARTCKTGWVICGSCRNALRPEKTLSGPPRFALCNGNLVTEFPTEIERIHPTAEGETTREIDIDEISDEMRALLAPVRPYGHIFAYSGGSHKSISGQMAYFEQDLPQTGGVFNDMRDMGASPNMYVMLCGRVTPHQREIIRKRSEMDTELYMDLLNWFITKSGHSGYKDMELPENFPTPVFIEDAETENNVDKSIRPDIEETYTGGTYYFTSAQDPTKDKSVYEDRSKFARAILTQTAPTLLAIGGSYANMKEIRVEDVLPFAFPRGRGGPKCRRRTPLSAEGVFQRYFRLSMKQFMRGDVILVLGHMYNRILSYRTGIIACRSRVNGEPVGETLARFTANDFNDTTTTGEKTEATKTLLNVVETTCRALGHTPEAAQRARKCLFAYNDHFGLNSFFFSLTPEDRDTFYIKCKIWPGEWVSSSVFVRFFPMPQKNEI